jgi:nucleotide-binding universal stress UspA family protein
MKKIIAAFDGLKFSESLVTYAIGIAKQSKAHLVGVSLEDVTYHSFKLYDVIDEKESIDTKIKKLGKKDNRRRQLSTLAFEAACQAAGINYSIHHDKSIALQELLHESIYADLLIINFTETLTHYKEKPPTRFIRDLLANVQCPVLLVPDKYKPIDKIAFLYDGEPSSVHAIKMFSYMFGSLKDLAVEIVTAKKDEQNLHLPDNTLMKEFMKRHFPAARYTVLKGEVEKEIVSYLKVQKANNLVVCGAYRRGMVSRWFRESMADVLMKSLKLPLFIAHYK